MFVPGNTLGTAGGLAACFAHALRLLPHVRQGGVVGGVKSRTRKHMLRSKCHKAVRATWPMAADVRTAQSS